MSPHSVENFTRELREQLFSHHDSVLKIIANQSDTIRHLQSEVNSTKNSISDLKGSVGCINDKIDIILTMNAKIQKNLEQLHLEDVVQKLSQTCQPTTRYSDKSSSTVSNHQISFHSPARSEFQPVTTSSVSSASIFSKPQFQVPEPSTIFPAVPQFKPQPNPHQPSPPKPESPSSALSFKLTPKPTLSNPPAFSFTMAAAKISSPKPEIEIVYTKPDPSSEVLDKVKKYELPKHFYDYEVNPRNCIGCRECKTPLDPVEEKYYAELEKSQLQNPAINFASTPANKLVTLPATAPAKSNTNTGTASKLMINLLK